jgi:hypothetical protein
VDFSGWFQVYLSASGTRLRAAQSKAGRILMGTGRDAADVALTTALAE